MIGPIFEVETVERGSRRQVVVRGEIDLKTAPELDEALDGLKADPLVVDMTDVTFIDSTGLRVLVMARSRVEGDGGRFVVCAADGSAVVRTMRLAGVASDFHVVASCDELPE
ncbi:MAG TPA: STAS domain-containing protein [Acidimicrobiia bacterium]|nr:STAS domain-containing protein [Acidimicrobiia bacterium]